MFKKTKEKISNLECVIKEQIRQIEIFDAQNAELIKKCSYLEGILSAKEETLKSIKVQLEDELRRGGELQKTVLNYLTVQPGKVQESISNLYEEDEKELKDLYKELKQEGFEIESQLNE